MHGTIGRSEARDVISSLDKLSRTHPQRLLSREAPRPADLHRGTEKKVLEPLRPSHADEAMAAVAVAIGLVQPPAEFESLMAKLAKTAQPLVPYAPGTTLAKADTCHASLPSGFPSIFRMEPATPWLESRFAPDPADRW